MITKRKLREKIKSDGGATILTGDVLDWLERLPSNSIQCVVTSPPYYGLRNYGVDGQIGLEKSPYDYAKKMVKVFREIRRILRDDGTVWLNLGDSYAGGGGGNYTKGNRNDSGHNLTNVRNRESWLLNAGVKPKDLLGIPWMVAFGLRADGWYLRQDIIWHKPNVMPESVRDRCTKSHEYMFLLTKDAKYYYDVEAIKETALTLRDRIRPNGLDQQTNKKSPLGFYNTCGSNGTRNKRTVWTITTQPYKGAHFATFPEKLVVPCIKAGTGKMGCCVTCGKPWKRIIKRSNRNRSDEEKIKQLEAKGVPRYTANLYVTKDRGTTTTIGWEPSCDCDCEDRKKCIVLDPFCGSGTTGKVARDLGRYFLGIELNPEYVRLAKKRIFG